MRLTPLLTLLALNATALVAQQVAIAPQPLANGLAPGPIRVQDLSDAYHAGQWTQLQGLLHSVLNSAAMATADGTRVRGSELFDLDRNYVIVVFATAHNHLARVLVHDPQPEPFSNVLPGLKGVDTPMLLEAWLIDGEGGNLEAAELASSYVFKKRDNPLTVEIPGVVKAMSPAIIGLIQDAYVSVFGTSGPGVTVNASLVPVPFESAELTITDKLSGFQTDDVAGKTTWLNVPKRYVSFEAVVGSILGSGGDVRAKLDGGVIRQDALGRGLTMVAVNFHPVGYEPGRDEMSPGERFRLFAGVTLTPTPGIAVGGSVGLARGVSISAGVASLLFNTPKATETIGQAPTVEDPFEVGSRWAFFFGLGFGVK